MDELEELRKRRRQELQAQAEARDQDPRAEAEAERSAQQDAVERLLQQVLEPEARERLTRIRMSRPDFHQEVVRQLVGLAQSGRVQRRLTDHDLRQVLQQLTPKDRDIRITRK